MTTRHLARGKNGVRRVNNEGGNTESGVLMAIMEEGKGVQARSFLKCGDDASMSVCLLPSCYVDIG